MPETLKLRPYFLRLAAPQIAGLLPSPTAMGWLAQMKNKPDPRPMIAPKKRVNRYSPEALYARHRISESNMMARKRGAFGRIPSKDLLLRMDLQEWKCMYCKDPITFWTAEIDHVHSIQRGGDHYLYNIVFACEPCNQEKRARRLERFCKIMGFDYETIVQEIADLNHKQHDLTNFNDEFSNPDPDEWVA